MLVLSRRVGEQIIVGNGLIKITLVSIRGYKVRIGIDAPKDIVIDRDEIHALRKSHEEAADERHD